MNKQTIAVHRGGLGPNVDRLLIKKIQSMASRWTNLLAWLQIYLVDESALAGSVKVLKSLSSLRTLSTFASLGLYFQKAQHQN